MNTLRYWRDEVRRHPILGGWLIIFVVHAGMNMKLGHELAGGEGPGALLYAAGFLGFAVLGAWAADNIAAAMGARKVGLILIALLQLLIGQMAGWQALGLTLSKGEGQLEAKAEARSSTRTALENARAQRAAIGTTRAIETIEAEERLECARTSRAYKDGVGPACTKLRAELGAARRAEVLEKDIARQTEKLGSGPAVRDAGAPYQAPQGIAQAFANGWAWMMGREPARIGVDDVRFGWMVFLVFAFEFFGTFGLALVRGASSGADPQPHGGRGGSGRTPGGPPSPGSSRTDAGSWSPDGAGSLRQAVEAVLGGLPAPALPVAQPLLALPAPSAADPRSMAMHGAPINIHFTAPATGSPPVPPSAPGVVMPGPAVSDGPAPATRPRRDLPALPGDAPPVDRSRVVRELTPEEQPSADVILAFRAACVVDAPGGVVSGAHLYGRYAYWAGPRALDEAAFTRLYRDLTGHEPVEIGGLGHWRGIALRAAPALQAVA